MPLTEGVFQYETDIDAGMPCASVTGITQERRFLEIPETLGGFPVRKIAPHAFSGKESLRAIFFPRSLRSVGAFALHKCPRLEEISLHDGISDFHNGVVRQDTRLQRVRIKVHENNFTVMRDILSDTDARLLFCLQMPDGEAHLLFPGYDYSFNENTMARTIQFSISGSGMGYRECVRRKGIGWREYDRQFPRVIPDDAQAAAIIAADRLLYPYDLASDHAKAYEEYLRTHAEEVLLYFVEEIALSGDSAGSAADEAYARLRMMADRGLICGDSADRALRAASERRMTEVCSIILSGREASFKKNRPAEQRFSIEEKGDPEMFYDSETDYIEETGMERTPSGKKTPEEPFSEINPPEESNLINDLSGDTLEDFSEDTLQISSEDTLGDFSEDTLQISSEDTLENFSEDASEDLSGEASEDLSGEASGDFSEDTSEGTAFQENSFLSLEDW